MAGVAPHLSLRKNKRMLDTDVRWFYSDHKSVFIRLEHVFITLNSSKKAHWAFSCRRYWGKMPTQMSRFSWDIFMVPFSNSAVDVSDFLLTPAEERGNLNFILQTHLVWLCGPTSPQADKHPQRHCLDKHSHKKKI